MSDAHRRRKRGTSSATRGRTIQKSLETKARNRRLIRVAQALQNYLAPGTVTQEAWSCVCVCWRSGAIVLGNRRAAKITMTDDRLFHLSFCDGWYDDTIFWGSASAIEDSAKRTMDEQPPL